MGPKKKGPAAGGAPAPAPVPEENYLKADNKIVLIKECTLSNEMQEDALARTREALDKFNVEREIATFLKQSFDRKYGPYWQCIVGRNFGSFVSYDDYYAYFYLGKVGILLYKNGHED